MAIYVKIDQADLNNMLTSTTGIVGQDIYKRAKRVEAKAKRLTPVNTGRLRASIGTTLTKVNGEVTARVGTNVKYGKWVHDGTGIYGPRKTPITPKGGKFLVFTPRGSKDVVFARSVRGMRGRAFLKDALSAAV